MDTFPILFFLLFLHPALVPGQDDCQILRCSNVSGPVIRFPFRLKNQHPVRCGYQGFDLFCLKNQTMLNLSSSGLFSVDDIDYKSQTISLLDPDGCLPKRLLNLSPSVSPFHVAILKHSYSYDYDYCNHESISLLNLSLLNCSSLSGSRNSPRDTWVDRKYLDIPCMSVPGHDLIVTSPDTSATEFSSCYKVTTIPFPDPCSVHGDIKDYKVYLRWSIPGFGDCESQGGKSRFKNGSENEIECFGLNTASHTGFQAGASHRSAIIGACVGTSIFLLISVASIAFFYHTKRSDKKEERENQVKIEKFLEDHKSHVPTRYTFDEIKLMTKRFNKRLGQGGFGTVFKGKLPNGVPVAIKVLNNLKGNGEDFINEVATIGRVHHVNVVRLLGFCVEGCQRCLIYEFMQHKSLERFISTKTKNPSLDWTKLHHIATGIAKGIDYLHQGCDQRILHFDIKPHNILLDHNFNPKISDFGLAKLYSKENSVVSMTAARGTIGYIAPEVFGRNFGNVSHKSDVYSFGMLVIEMIGGRTKCAYESKSKSSSNQAYFPESIYKLLIEEGDLGFEGVNKENMKIAKKLMIVSLWCIQWYPINRPSMKAVIRMLEVDNDNLSMPPNPLVSTTQTTLSTEALPLSPIVE